MRAADSRAIRWRRIADPASILAKGTGRRGQRPVSLEVLAYAPTEFFHCQHCELVWHQVGLGQRFRADQRSSGQLPADLEAEYAAISDWLVGTVRRHGQRICVKVVDAASLEGFWKAVRHRVHRLPAFIIDGRRRLSGFDVDRLEAELAACLKPAQPVGHDPTDRRSRGGDLS